MELWCDETDSKDPIIIAVIGPTMSGKSSFIRLISGNASVEIGNGLEPQTRKVRAFDFMDTDSGRKLTIVDTPGFDGSQVSDTEVLKKISNFLLEEYDAERKLNGLVYFQRISDTNHAGQSQRNLRMIKELCGTGTYRNLVILTTLWDTVSQYQGEFREEQLKSNFLQPLIQEGAKFMRYNRTLSSAQRVLDYIVTLVPNTGPQSQLASSMLKESSGQVPVPPSWQKEETLGNGSFIRDHFVPSQFETLSDSDRRVFPRTTKTGLQLESSLLESSGQKPTLSQSFQNSYETVQEKDLITEMNALKDSNSELKRELAVKEEMQQMQAKWENSRKNYKTWIRELEFRLMGSVFNPASLDSNTILNTVTQQQLRPQVFIMLIGERGIGKTTFVNLAGGSRFTSGEGFESCAQPIQRYHLPFADKDATLIDVPGFGDANESDVDILKTITDYLAKEYQEHRTMTGVLYFYCISADGMGDAARRNLTMVQKLCGSDAFGNVVIVTTQWDEEEEKAAKAHLVKLREESFEEILDGGGEIFHHDRSPQSAKEILIHLVSKDAVSLLIQREIVLEHKRLVETAAGEELHREIRQQVDKLKEKRGELIEEREKTHEDLMQLKDMEDEYLELQMAHWYTECEKLANSNVQQSPSRRTVQLTGSGRNSDGRDSTQPQAKASQQMKREQDISKLEDELAGVRAEMTVLKQERGTNKAEMQRKRAKWEKDMRRLITEKKALEKQRKNDKCGSI